MVDLCKAPAGAERFCPSNAWFLKRDLDLVYWWNVNTNRWSVLHESVWGSQVWKHSISIYEDLPVTEEEDEAFNALGQVYTSTGSVDLEQGLQGMMPPSKYHVNIHGKWCDVYDVLSAFDVTNPGDQHAIKKMLLPGKRGHKDGIKDRREAIQSLERAIELENQNDQMANIRRG